MINNMAKIITPQYYVLTKAIVCIVWLYGTFAADDTVATTLRKNILRNYDNHSRPSQDHKEATKVAVSFYYRGIELDEKRKVVTLHLLCFLHWKDEHVKWDPKSYDNLTEIPFGSYELWKPDLAVLNNVGSSDMDYFGNTPLIGTFDSVIIWFPPAKFEAACELDLTYWPFDVHTCYIQIASWAHDANQITFILPENYSSFTTEDSTFFAVYRNREWNITWNSVETNTYNVSNYPPDTDVVITLELQRKGSTHIAVVLMIATGIACIILASFWLNPLAKERVPLILCVMILNILGLDNIYRTIPNNGNSVPLIVSYYRDSLIMVTFGLMWTVLLRYIASSKRSSPVPLPTFISSILDSWAVTIMCLKPRPSGKSPSIPTTEDDEKELVKATNPYQEDWAWLAFVLDRFMFIIFLIIYVCFFIAFF